MKRLIYLLLLTPFLLFPQTVYFEQNFNVDNFDETDWWPAYNFDGCMFGYSDNKIQNSTNDWYNDSADSTNAGSHKIPVYGLTGTQTNFDIHFLINEPAVSQFYYRFCLKPSSNFPDGGENWKWVYHYGAAGGGNNWVFWGRSRTFDGWEPMVYGSANGESLSHFKTEAVATWFVRDYVDEWTCFILYVDHTNDHVSVWISTEDDTYDETLYIDADGDFDGGWEATAFCKFGAYWDGTEVENTYFLIDEIKIASTYAAVALSSADLGGTAPTPPPLSDSTRTITIRRTED